MGHELSTAERFSEVASKSSGEVPSALDVHGPVTKTKATVPENAVAARRPGTPH